MTVDVVVNGHVTTEVAEHLRVPEGATEHIVVTEHLATQSQGAPALPIAPPVLTPAPGAAHHAPPSHVPAPQPAPQPDATGQHPGSQQPAPTTVPLYVETQDPAYSGAHLHTQPGGDAPLVPLNPPYIPNGAAVEASGQPVTTHAGEQWYHVTYQGVHQGYVLGTLLSRNRPAAAAARSGHSAAHSVVAPGHAALPSTMQPSAHCYAMIEGFEGWVPHLYNDSGSNATIGYGHLVHLGPINDSDRAAYPNGITQTQGAAILQSDVATAVNAVRAYVTVPLTQYQFDALVSFTFNVGSGNFAGSTLLQDLNKGEYNAAAAQFLVWQNASRRATERQWFEGQDVQPSGQGQQQGDSPAAASSKTGPGTYVVQSGDTLGTIATRFRVSLTDLENANQWLYTKRHSWSVLQVEDQLHLPSGASSPRTSAASGAKQSNSPDPTSAGSGVISPSNPYLPFGNPDCTLWAWEEWHDKGVDLDTGGDASTWVNIGSATIDPTGQRVAVSQGSSPQVNAIVVFNQGMSCTAAPDVPDYQDQAITPYTVYGWGHVAFVTSVDADGWFTVSEENHGGTPGPRIWHYQLGPGMTFLYFPDH